MRLALLTFLGGMLTVLAGIGLVQYLSGDSKISAGRVAPAAVESQAGESSSRPGDGEAVATIDTSLIAHPIERAYPESIRLNLRAMLAAGDFTRLNHVLDGMQRVSRSDAAAEDTLWAAYNAFQINDPATAALFAQWIEATPGAYQPLLARAYFHYRQAWNARGHSWRSETSSAQIEQMRAWMQKSLEDVTAAMAIDDRVLPAHGLLIGIHSASSDREKAALVLEQALQVDPYNYRVRARYLGFLIPRWRGSYEEMEEFVRQALIHEQHNPRLRLLAGQAYSEVARDQATIQAHSRAEELNTSALEYGQTDDLYRARGMNRFKQEKWADALEDFDRAVDLGPEVSLNYYWRSLTQANLKNYHESVADIMRADELEPDDGQVRKHVGWLEQRLIYLGYESKKNRQLEPALEKFNLVLQMSPAHANAYYRRAGVLTEMNQLELALLDLRQSIELDPNDIDPYLLVDWVLSRRQDYDAVIDYWDRYIELNPDNGRAYVQRGGAYYRKGDYRTAVANAKKSADLGDKLGQEAYDKYRHLAR